MDDKRLLISYSDLRALGIPYSRETLRRWMKDEDKKAPKPPFPKPVKLGRRVAWRLDEIMAFVEQISRRKEK